MRPSVEFTDENIALCICGTCPVQASSACATDKALALEMALAADPADPPGPADVPGVYCSTGKATCDDLDFREECICPSCAVYAENSLAGWKYCEQGDATRVG